MKNKIELPFHTPMFSAYHWKAAACIVLQNNPTSDNWYFNNCIQLLCNDKFLTGKEESPGIIVENTHAWNISVLQKSGIINQFARYSVGENIQAMLESGFYVNFMGVDDYYIQNKGDENNCHLSHDGILLGLNNKQKTYTIAAYKSDRHFGLLEIPQESFYKGFHSEYVNYQGELLGIKCIEEISIPLEIDHIYFGIKKYLHSITPDCKDKQGLICGIITMIMLEKYVQMVLDGDLIVDQLDARTFLTVKEHKICMCKRLKRLAECKYIEPCIFSSYENDVVKASENLRLLSLKYNYTKQAALLPQLIDVIRHLYKSEQMILGQVVNK